VLLFGSASWPLDLILSNKSVRLTCSLAVVARQKHQVQKCGRRRGGGLGAAPVFSFQFSVFAFQFSVFSFRLSAFIFQLWALCFELREKVLI